MKVLHVVPSFYPAHYYGGPIQSVYSLCRHVASRGHTVRVLTTNANGPNHVLDVESDHDHLLEAGLTTRYCRRIALDCVSPGLLLSLPSQVRWADVVHVTAVYSFPVLPALSVARILGKPVVWSPRGALQRWQGSTNLALKNTWDVTGRAVAPRDLALHVTSREEALESLARYPRAKPAIIPNGVDIPDSPIRSSSDGPLRILYLGRIHPKKGIENLLEACRSLDLTDTAYTRWSLTIAGSGDDAYVRQIAGLAQGVLGVTMAGPVGGERKEQLFRDHDLLVLPSYTENFGMVVAEALARAMPVIASTATPWNQVVDHGCGLWTANQPVELAAALRTMASMRLHEMGAQGRSWMLREYSWAHRGDQMIELYQALHGHN